MLMLDGNKKSSELFSLYAIDLGLAAINRGLMRR